MSSPLTKSKLEVIFENASNKAFKESFLTYLVMSVLAFLGGKFGSVITGADYSIWGGVVANLVMLVLAMLGYMSSKDKEIKKQMGQHLDWRE